MKGWAESQGYGRYLGSSIKGESAIDWSDKMARTGLLGEVVADADRLLEVARQAQGTLPEGSAEREGIVAAAELLGQLLHQDVERAGDGIGLKVGVSKDRMISVHDPEMRHGHKSSSRRFDGHKAAIVVDTDTQLITAVEVLPGNAPDNLGALELVERSEANTGIPVEEAFGSMEQSAEYARCGPGAWPGHRDWGEWCNCTHRKTCCSRPAPCSGARPLPGTVNGGWWWSTGWPGWCSWGFARLATSGGPEPGSSCTWRPQSPT